MTHAHSDLAPPARFGGGFTRWVRGGGWLLLAAGVPVIAILSTTFDLPPRYEALSRPPASTDQLPSTFPPHLVAVIHPGSPRLLGTDDATSYYLAAPAGAASGLCFVAADLAKPTYSQVGCSSPGLGGGFQFADVTLSDHRPGDAWVEIAEDVWRDTEYREFPATR